MTRRAIATWPSEAVGYDSIADPTVFGPSTIPTVRRCKFKRVDNRVGSALCKHLNLRYDKQFLSCAFIPKRVAICIERVRARN
jgi:hypothetical protein